MEPNSQIKYLIGNLPEVYQPIYGFNEFNDNTTRHTYDRWQVVQAVADKLRAELGRPLRILDIGCAQGFFCFNLASAGDEVFGVDWKPENIALCRELAKVLSLKATFVNDDLITGIESLPVNDFDLLIGFSIFHHVCHRLGFKFTRQYIGELSKKAKVCLFETAVKEEPMDWAVSLPEDPRGLLDKFAFLEKLSEHSTRLSKVKRPIYFCSNHYWYVNEELQAFDTFVDSSHINDLKGHEGMYRNYMTHDKTLKYYRFVGPQSKTNQGKLEAEIAFLNHNSALIDIFPRLMDYKLAEHGGWILREKIPGITLSAAITNNLEYNPDAVIENILDQLTRLEAAGLYHNDLRACNILLSENGKAILLDYAAIQKTPNSVVPPENIYLGFLVFLYEVLHKKILTVRKLSPMLIRKSSYPVRYHNLVQGVLANHPGQWSFSFIAKLFHHQHIINLQSLQLADSLQPWLDDMESNIAKRKVKLKYFERLLLKRLTNLRLGQSSWFKKFFKRYDALVD